MRHLIKLTALDSVYTDQLDNVCGISYSFMSDNRVAQTSYEDYILYIRADSPVGLQITRLKTPIEKRLKSLRNKRIWPWSKISKIRDINSRIDLATTDLDVLSADVRCILNAYKKLKEKNRQTFDSTLSATQEYNYYRRTAGIF